jgi:hypothetical protein
MTELKMTELKMTELNLLTRAHTPRTHTQKHTHTHTHTLKPAVHLACSDSKQHLPLNPKPYTLDIFVCVVLQAGLGSRV